MSWQVLYTKRANEDLQNIYRYIAEELKVPETAQKLTIKILDQIDNLNEMPKRNPLYDKEPWKSRGLRKLIIDNFIAFYLTNESQNQVIILAIMYGGRDIGKLI